MIARRRLRGVAIAAALIFFACGGDSQEEQLAAANEHVAEAQKGVEEAQEEVERRQDGLEKAQAELAESMEDLEDAEARLAEAKDELAQVADDTYLFRAVQSALLAEPALEGHAIAARVSERVVTLEGEVPSLDLRKKAGEVAEGTLGVERVKNDVAVVPPANASP